MKDLNKNNITLRDLKKIIKESNENDNIKTLSAAEEALSDVIDILNDWHSEMDHSLYSQLWDNVDQAVAWIMEVKESLKKKTN